MHRRSALSLILGTGAALLALPSGAGASVIVYDCGSLYTGRTSVCAVDPEGGPVRTLLTDQNHSAPTVTPDGKQFGVVVGDANPPTVSRLVTAPTDLTSPVASGGDTSVLRDLQPPVPVGHEAFVDLAFAGSSSSYVYTSEQFPGSVYSIHLVRNGADTVVASQMSGFAPSVGVLGADPFYRFGTGIPGRTCLVTAGDPCHTLTDGLIVSSGSADGRRIVTVTVKRVNGEIRSTGSQVRDASTMKVLLAKGGTLSPDGKFLAYNDPVAHETAATQYPIKIVPVDGSAPPRTLAAAGSSFAWGGTIGAATKISGSSAPTVRAPKAAVSGADLRRGLRVSVRAAKGARLVATATVAGRVVARRSAKAGSGATTVRLPVGQKGRDRALETRKIRVVVRIGSTFTVSRTVRVRRR